MMCRYCSNRHIIDDFDCFLSVCLVLLFTRAVHEIFMQYSPCSAVLRHPKTDSKKRG